MLLPPIYRLPIPRTAGENNQKNRIKAQIEAPRELEFVESPAPRGVIETHQARRLRTFPEAFSVTASLEWAALFLISVALNV